MVQNTYNLSNIITRRVLFFKIPIILRNVILIKKSDNYSVYFIYLFITS